jgi:hypothetical protein
VVSVIQTLLIWLLVLAMPGQGAAAATMAFCGPKHHGGVAVGAADPAARSDHGHGGVDSTGADGHPRADAMASGDDDRGDLAQASVGSADPHQCNLCGSCCSTCALMSAVPHMPAPDAASIALAAAEATVDPYAADGPDRPPRILPV